LDDYLLSALLGIIEGLTEFLPVSSTAHLRIAEQLLGLDLSNGYWKMYAIVIQLGAILCLPIYFRARIAKFVSTFPKGERGNRTALTHPLTLVMIAFIVTAIPAFLLTKLIGKHLENLTLMAWALIVGGIIMWIVDAVYAKRFRVSHMEEMSLGQAIWIGACQILPAVFPGTSRSMATIAGGQIAGMSREAALEFSFFLSMPTMAAATLYDLLKFMRHGGVGAMSRHEWTILAIGFVVSFLVAWGVVAWFMHWVRRHGFVPFAVYRIVAGIAVLVWLSRLVYR
jgi:undecaprenyl-diphosphatase